MLCGVPQSNGNAGTDRDDHGMPSSHAQFILFLSVYLCVALVLVFEIGKKPLGRLLVLGSLAMAAIVSWSRTYLGYHTLPQVAVGAATGAAMALFWFFLVVPSTFLQVFIYPFLS